MLIKDCTCVPRGGLWRDEVRALGGSGSQCVVMSVVAW